MNDHSDAGRPILTRVEYLHRKCFIHRDIKPENFLMGLGRHRTQVFMIDFGLAKKFYSLRSQQHIGYTENRDLVGTARYASARAHYAEQGRRDDLESVGYLLLYFQRGRLPGRESGLSRRSRILPVLEVLSNLPFYQKPDYVYLHQLFKVLFRNQMMLYDFQYDWVTLQRESKALCDKQKDEKKERRACSCSYHRHKKHHRGRQLELQAERRRHHPEQPEESHRVPPCL
ncbi:hypothetical protein M5D96_000044 [Drosophila gunungcola]|uniref:non-specific serine/threonine protein kinase n=1 Tax=Drosophila gunungcola TaxID=103775 RepID=A0A9P9YVG0_9MUSC|nr:hypothetical protein M5D96_000044 [Drosophila gunungcola]